MTNVPRRPREGQLCLRGGQLRARSVGDPGTADPMGAFLDRSSNGDTAATEAAL